VFVVLDGRGELTLDRSTSTILEPGVIVQTATDQHAEWTITSDFRKFYFAQVTDDAVCSASGTHHVESADDRLAQPSRHGAIDRELGTILDATFGICTLGVGSCVRLWGDEVVILLTGVAQMQHADSQVLEVRAGTVLRGWPGGQATWNVAEPVSAFFVRS